MKRQSQASLGVMAFALMGFLLFSPGAHAQVNADYHSVPPFIPNVITPNVLILMDNSGSMTNRACEATSCGKLPDGSTSTVTNFVATTTYSGFFNSLSCYTYNSGNTRFVAGASKVAVSTSCPITEWDGNFLNWATFRRFDAVKKALIGGDCVVARNPDGTCPPSGSPALITIKGDTVFDSSSRGHETTASIPAVGPNGYTGRVPTSVTVGVPGNLYVHLRGGQAGMQGTFCVDDDSGDPSSGATSCSDGDSFAESQFRVRLALTSEPTGVIQQIGNKARFGLMVFKGAGDGGRVLTGIGLRQAIDFNGSTVETFNTNTAAMIDAVQESFATTWTPLAESLYDGVRYIAQINSTFNSNAYTYPIAFSGGNSNGVSFQSTGVGSVGPNEVSVLASGESCPAGYINNACGRDPYFYGSNPSPAPPWSTPSKVITCCKTFIIVFTDGEPTKDKNIPSNLQDNPGLPAHASGVPSAIHGLHCTGGNGTVHNPNGTCNTNPGTPATTLIGDPGDPTKPGEHRTDYADEGKHYLDDVAYWAHTTDLRQGTIPVINEAGHDLPGNQNVMIYTFYAFGNIAGREILMHAAKQGSFEDSNGNNIPDQKVEYDKENNFTGAATPDGVPDAYFESADVDDLQEQMLATITSILRKSSSGTSVSVLATSSTGEGALYQSYFYPNTLEPATLNDVKWTGYSQGLFVDAFGNTREDTNGDGKLIYQNDKIIKTRYDAATGQVKVDKYVDSNGDGKADSTTPTEADRVLSDIAPIWEAGKRLALTDSSARRLLTWVDSDNDSVVDPGEQIEFAAANSTTLAPYLRAGSAPYTATNIINFIRGDQVSGLRDRQLTVSGTLKVWKLGDPIHATPVVVGTPKERYDVIYGDPSYTAYYQRYKDRRQVAYIGANDGMLHAFNAGYYHRGDDPTTSTVTEHGWFTRTPTDNSSGKLLGDELWGFIPYQLLPHLQWLARPDYLHVYYVDLKPKVTDARIFTPDADHPNGWGTILIGGFRLGGSCGACTASSGARPMSVTANFGSGTQTRTFYSAYFVLDVTNPEADPKLLWVFSDVGLGLTTSYPAVVRVNPSGDATTNDTNAKWFVIFGSGPTSYEIKDNSTGIAQSAKLYAVNLTTGPGSGNSLATTMPIGFYDAFMGDLVTLDKDLDYRTDVAYVGRVIHDGSLPWRGKMHRLTTGGCSAAPCVTATWGIALGSYRTPTEVLDTFPPSGSSMEPGPITAAPAVTVDDSNKVWLFFGTGRFYGSDDKTNADTQYFFGIKDSVFSGCVETSVSSCHDNDLVNVSSATVCTVCTGAQVTGVSGVTTLEGTSSTSLQGLVASKDGWYTTLPTSRERVLVTPTLIGGVVFFPTYVPVNDICQASGDGYLYALFYLTGSANKESVIGTTTSGGNTNVKRSISLGTGTGVASQLAIQIGAQGSGVAGSGGTGSGCQGALTGYIQSSTGLLSSYCANAGGATSRYISWLNQRD